MDCDMKFESLCQELQNILNAPKDKKVRRLGKLLSFLRESNNFSGASFFSFVRLLLPAMDTERGSYGMKQITLARTLVRILCLPKDGSDANKLLKFRSQGAGKSAGDFADVAFWVLKSRCRNGGTLSVQDVNARLDQIATLNASNKPRGVDDELLDIIKHMSAEEIKWLIRIILEDLHIGLGRTAILNAVHPDAKELYNVSHNLRKVCNELRDPSKRLHEIEVSVFEPFRPMSSERCDILQVERIFSKSSFYFVERKHDGERFQMHLHDNSFRYYSRNGIDYSHNYGDSINFGTLTPLLAKQLDSSVKTCIVDGEMMLWHKKLKCFGSKGLKCDVKSLREEDAHRPCYIVFDLLMLNGEVLTNKPLKDRVVSLKQIFTPLVGVVMDSPQKRITCSKEVVNALNDAIDRQEEGLILKNPDSIYKPAAKIGGGWYKIKPEYTVGLTDELDLIIMGGYFGDGQNKTKISHFLVGVAVPSNVDGGDPLEFHSLGRVGSGYSRDELAELLNKLEPHWKPVKAGLMPRGLVWTKERPNVWIEPQNSQILQIKASEIVESENYKTGFTLRFPRVEKIRYDKKWSECSSSTEFDNLKLSNCGKLATRHVTASELCHPMPSKRSRVRVVPTVGRDHQAADLTGTTQRGSVFSGLEICVLSGNDRVSKQELERRIHEQRGTIVQYTGPETYCVVAGKKDLRVKNLLEKRDIDVVTVEWVLSALDSERLLEWKPQDLLAMSSKTRDDMAMKYDEFCDSYYDPISIEALKLSLEKVAEMGLTTNLLPSEMGDIDVELFPAGNEFAVFRCCVACFIASDEESQYFKETLLKSMFRFQGGRISDLQSPDVTHVVIDPQGCKNLVSIRNANHLRPKKFRIVTYDWIDSCWRSKHRLKEEDYCPFSLMQA